MSRFISTLDQWCGNYGVLVNQLGGRSLELLAVATVGTGLYLFSASKVTASLETIYMVYGIALLYLAWISWYIRYKRNANPTPPAPIEFVNLHTFFRSIKTVGALIFFFACDEPIKSVRHVYIAMICICAFIHILVILAIFRRRDDYGVSDGLLAAAFALLFPLCDTIWRQIYLGLGTVFFVGLRNLQLQSPTLNPQTLPVSAPPVPPSHANMNNPVQRGRQRPVRRQPQASRHDYLLNRRSASS